jgi:cytoskeletal protein RodZ
MFKKLTDKLWGTQSDEPFQQPEDASALVANRRMKRRIKAAVSVTLAIGAGAFLSCQRFLGLEEQEETKATQEPKSQASTQTATQPASTSQPQTMPESAPASIPTTSALTTTTSQPTPPKHKKKTSTTKHKKGMPVLDNLLE